MLGNYRSFCYLLSWVLLALAGVMAIPMVYSLLVNEPIAIDFANILLPTAGLGGLLALIGRRKNLGLSRPEWCFFIIIAYLCLAALVSLPYQLILDSISLNHAWFEAVSGITTTGATTIPDPGSLPAGLQLWRSCSQWFGGALALILMTWLLPILGIGDQQLVYAAGTNPKQALFLPFNFRSLSVIPGYIIITAVCSFAFGWAGMDSFSAINHALTLVSHGGFSLYADSFASIDNPRILVVAIVAMFASLLPLALVLWRPRQLGNLAQAGICLIIIIVTIFLMQLIVAPTSVTDFGKVIFTVTASITGTGFRIVDYSIWPPAAVTIICMLMLIGGSSATAASGIKIYRPIIAAKMIAVQLKLQTDSRRIAKVTFAGRNLEADFVQAILGFMLIFFIIILLLIALLQFSGLDLITSIGTTIATLANAGPGLGSAGPLTSYQSLPAPALALLSISMILGRIEILPAFMLLALLKR